MTDRELLELAAKAAGIPIDRSETNGGGVGNDGFGLTGDLMLDWHNDIRWNPLRDDGDALRLAVKLRLCLDTYMDPSSRFYTDERCTLVVLPPPSDYSAGEWHADSDQYAATRRAITRAAAAIGEAMP